MLVCVCVPTDVSHQILLNGRSGRAVLHTFGAPVHGGGPQRQRRVRRTRCACVAESSLGRAWGRAVDKYKFTPKSKSSRRWDGSRDERWDKQYFIKIKQAFGAGGRASGRPPGHTQIHFQK